MEEFERQDFNQLTEQLVEAMMGTTDAKAKGILKEIASSAEKLHKNFKGMTKAEWSETEGRLHGLYSSLLTTEFNNALLLGEIKISMDKLLMDTLPMEKKEEIVPEEKNLDDSSYGVYDEDAWDEIQRDIALREYDQEEFDRINRDIRNGRY